MGSLEHAHGYFYTYYYASNYIEKSGGAATITKDLTSAHTKNIINSIKKNNMVYYSPAQLTDLETQYNTRVTNQNEIMKNLIENAKKNKSQYALNALEIIVKKAIKVDNATAQKIANNIKWDEVRQVPYYAGTDFIKTGDNKSVFATWNPGKVKEYRIAQYAINRINDAIDKLESNFTKQQCKEYVNELKDLKKKIEKLNTVKIDANGKVKGSIPINHEQLGDIAQLTYNAIVRAKSELEGIANLNKNLSWIYTELIGHLVADSVQPFALRELGKQITSWSLSKTAGNTDTSVKNKNDFINAQIKFLDQGFLKEMEKAATTIALNGKSSTESFVEQINQNNDEVVYTLKKQVASHGKSDADLFMTLKDGTKINTGVSIKNYSMNSKEFTLQGNGYLLNYLEDDASPKFMNHILNLYAKHPDTEEGDRAKYPHLMPMLQEYAKDALRISLLYAALTGYHQGREGREAHLLVVYDKRTKRGEAPLVRVYSMANIILDMIESGNYSGVHVSPSLDSPLFENEKVTAIEDTKEGNEAAARVRFTKVLWEARSKNMSISLAKKILT